MSQADIGLVGLAVMGENLILNMESRGFTVACFPVKIRGASAGWTRAVAIFDEVLMAAHAAAAVP